MIIHQAYCSVVECIDKVRRWCALVWNASAWRGRQETVIWEDGADHYQARAAKGEMSPLQNHHNYYTKFTNHRGWFCNLLKQAYATKEVIQEKMNELENAFPMVKGRVPSYIPIWKKNVFFFHGIDQPIKDISRLRRSCKIHSTILWPCLTTDSLNHVSAQYYCCGNGS